MDRDRDRTAGRVATALGVTTFASLASLAVFFAVGGPFGTLNDVGNAAVGILSLVLAWTLRPPGWQGSRRRAALWSAGLGAAIAVAGSAMVISGTTGFFLAGLVSSVGFAFIGIWLVAISRSVAADARWPPRLGMLGVAAGVLMVVGFATAPGIALGLDDMETAPGWIWIGYLGWLGTFLLMPSWAIWLGRVLGRRSGDL